MTARHRISKLWKTKIGFPPGIAAKSYISFDKTRSDDPLPDCRLTARVSKLARAVRRRQMLRFAIAGLAALSIPALAQPQRRARRIGYLNLTSGQGSADWLAAFRKGMAELRWVEGRDYVIDARHAGGVPQAGPSLAAELVATRPDLLLTTADEPARLLAQRTKTIPIVFVTGQNPVGSGVAASLRRPGGNVTGLTTLAIDLAAKRLQLLKEAFPRVAHVVLLFQPANVGSLSQVKEIEEAAARLGTRITSIGLRQAADIEAAFKRGAALGAHAYMVTSGSSITTHPQAIADRVLRAKVPAIFERIEFVEAGGLMSY